MTIIGGWREQYDRMHRTYARLADFAEGRARGSSDEARDVLFHFFQDAYHLNEWLKNSGTSPGIDTKQRPVLALCADLCNGTKHYRLDPARRHHTGDPTTGFTSQSVTVRPGTIHAVAHVPSPGSDADPPKAFAEPPLPALHYWTVESNGVSYDALTLAGDVVAEWDRWLRSEGLL